MKSRIIVIVFSLLFLSLSIVSFVNALYLQGALGLTTVVLLGLYQLLKEHDKKKDKGGADEDKKDT